MGARIATGVAPPEAGQAGFTQAAERAAEGIDGVPVDLAVVFAGGREAMDASDGLAAVREVLPARAVVGCGAQGVVGGGRELEEGGVAEWAGSFPEAAVETFHLEAVRAGDALAVGGMPELDSAEAMILLIDPYTFPVEPLLAQIGADHPGLPVIGGLSSAGGGPGRAVLMHGDEVARTGAVGVTLSGVGLRPFVSQGARPIGPEMAITSAEDNVIHELASRPALDRLKTAITELDELEQRALIERRRDPNDRRRHLVQLTADGKKTLKRLRALSRRLEDEFLAPLSDAERAQLHALLLRLAETHEPRCTPYASR
jgi:small ligand-binding sensory domain FIST